MKVHEFDHLFAMSSGSSSSRGGGLISTRVKCRCGAFAVVRMAKSGDNAGMKFFGCPNWPVSLIFHSYTIIVWNYMN